MDIRTLQAEAANLAAIAEKGDLTEEQSVRFDEVLSTIENRKAQAEKAARAISLVKDTEVVETVAVETAGTIGQTYVRSGKAGSRDRVSANMEIRATLTGDIVVNPTLDNVATPSFKAPLTSIVSVTPVTTGDVTIVTATPTYGDTIFTAEGTNKEEVELTYTSEVKALGTMTGFIKASRQALSDSAQLASDIDRELTQNLVRKIENHIAGTLSTATFSEVESDDILSAASVAKAIVDSGLYTANTIVLNPIDKSNIDVAVLGLGGTSPIVNNVVWGLNIVTSAAVTQGTAYVGDFAAAVKFYTKNGVEVYTTDADGTDFIKNIVTVLAEARGIAAVVAPAAIVKIVPAVVPAP